MTRVLGRDDLLTGDSLKRELVPVPQLNASLWMREMSGDHVIEFRRYIEKLKTDGIAETTFEQDIEIMKMVIAFSACDENGNLLFSSAEEAKELSKNNLNVLMDLGNKALEISGVKMNGAGLTSEVADNLPNGHKTSLSENSHKSSRKRAKKS